MPDLAMSTPVAAPAPARRLIAAGRTQRIGGRVLTVRVTAAGVTGTITPAVNR
ncbi:MULTISPECIES: hypothetical protein [Streptomyces]|uniref:hypothetical protein n=1 Tax=Streptomyces TaxID=1883 RepID=UPI000AC774A8|nr:MULTISPECIES: hypothetical protein [Streptomyces]